MKALDGLYRHQGSSTRWDAGGVTLTRRGRAQRLGWEDILDVRQVDDRPGYVQLVVKGHLPSQRLSEDDFSIPVNSDADANRLLTTLGWLARGRGLDSEQRA